MRKRKRASGKEGGREDSRYGVQELLALLLLDFDAATLGEGDLKLALQHRQLPSLGLQQQLRYLRDRNEIDRVVSFIGCYRRLRQVSEGMWVGRYKARVESFDGKYRMGVVFVIFAIVYKGLIYSPRDEY